MIKISFFSKTTLLLIFFLPLSLFTKTHISKNNVESELISIQKKTIETYNELLILNKTIKNLNVEIKKNKQSQLILKKYINNEESIAEGLILLLQEKYYNEPVKEFFQNFSKNNNFITKKIMKKHLSLIHI